MSTDIGTNPPAVAGAEGVQGGEPGYEAGDAPDGDQGQPSQSTAELDADGNPVEPTLEMIEWDLDGKKIPVPKALEPHLMKAADYTQKTQEVAEQRRQLETQFAEREQLLAQQQAAAQTLHQGRAQLAALDMKLQEYQGINWQAASAQDATATQQAWMQYQQLREQRQGVAGQLQAAEQQFVSQVTNQAQERVRSVVSKWSPEEVAAVSEIGSKVYGITPQHMALFGANPALLNILKDAVLHQKATAKAAEAIKPQQQAPKPAAQLPQGNRSPSVKPFNDPTLSDEEWNKRRREQLRKRR